MDRTLLNRNLGLPTDNYKLEVFDWETSSTRKGWGWTRFVFKIPKEEIIVNPIIRMDIESNDPENIKEALLDPNQFKISLFCRKNRVFVGHVFGTSTSVAEEQSLSRIEISFAFF